MSNLRLPSLLALSILALSTSSCSISLFNDLSLKHLEGENKIVTEAIDSNNTNFHAWFLRGRELIRKGQPEMALDAFEKSIELKPEYQEAWIGIGYAYLRMEDWEEAQAAFEELLALESKAPEGIEGLAISLFEQGEIERAKSLCLEAIEYDGKLYRAHQVLGQIYYSELNYALAELHWRLALLYGAPPVELEPVYQDLRLYLEKYGK